MDSLDPVVGSFIVKMWFERDGLGKWRGRITHVPSGECGYVNDLKAITAFIAPYLKRAGVRMGVRWRIRQWLRR